MPKQPKYKSELAGEFWSKRLQSTDPLAAVLTYSAPKALNELYDRWERNALVTAIGKLPKGTSSLDIGCGVGRITLLLAEMKADATGVDVSEKMLLQCAKEAKRRKLQSRVTLVQTSAELIPFANNSFDLITCCGLLEHLPEEPRKRCLKEALRLLKQRGRLFMVVNNSDNIFLPPRYHLKQQRSDGYFATLVGLDWLHKECRKQKAQLKVIASNPWYGLLHYGIFTKAKPSSSELNKLCRFAEIAEKKQALPDLFSRQLASHFLVAIRK